MVDAATIMAADLIAQGFSSDIAIEHAALIYGVREGDVAATLRAWRELPVEFDPPPVATW